jgi:tetratricopeptide (TPR) repeat protein
VKTAEAGNEPPGWRLPILRLDVEESILHVWFSGRGDPTALLSEAWLLGMKASLRVAQRRLPEGLALLDQAVELDQDKRFHGTLLVARAKALEEFGDFEGSIALLREAAPFVDEAAEPRLYLCLWHNLAWVSTTAGRHEEAATIYPEVAPLSRKMGKELDWIRLHWLEGRIAAGLGEADRAVQILTEVRGEFADRRIFYDCAMVSIELASVYASRGSTQQVKAIARHLVPILASQQLHEEALAALVVFRRAAEVEEATVELLGRIWNFLLRARHQAGLRFGE